MGGMSAWSGRLVAALTLAAAGLLLLSTLQQESPLRPTPLAMRRPPPAWPAESVVSSESAPKLTDNEIIRLDVGSVPDARSVPNVGSVPEPRNVPSAANGHASSAILSDDATNTTQHRVLNKTQTKQTPAGAAGVAVLTRALYAGGHTWSAAGLCPMLGARLRLVVLVTSAPAHRANRDGARLTWAGARRRDIAVAFFIGIPPANLTAELEKERDLYGDIIMGNFVDTYTNLTLKTISMLEWTATYCPRVPRLLKTDDDMFINTPRLLDFLAARENVTNTIWGRVVRRWLPNRNPRSKYYVSRTQYPDKTFPTFATGPAYVVTSDALWALHRAALSPTARYLNLEDVAVTGLAARRAGVRLVNAGEFVNKHVRPSACALRNLISLHMVSVELQLELWRKLHTADCKG